MKLHNSPQSESKIKQYSLGMFGDEDNSPLLLNPAGQFSFELSSLKNVTIFIF